MPLWGIENIEPGNLSNITGLFQESTERNVWPENLIFLGFFGFVLFYAMFQALKDNYRDAKELDPELTPWKWIYR